MTEDDNEGHAVSEGIDDSCHSIAPSWPFCDHRHAWLATAAGVTIGHENGGLFVARENQWNIILLMESVEQREDVVSWQGRDEFYSLGPEDIHDGICNTHVSSYLSTGFGSIGLVRADHRNGKLSTW
jgi:hypothetical protein